MKKKILLSWGLITMQIRWFVFISFLFVLICSPNSASTSGKELHLLAGAGLRGPTDLIIADFVKKTKIQVVVEYGGSGKLMARYLVSGKGDLYMPGDYFYIDRLKIRNKISSDIPLLFHTPVIAVNRAKQLTVTSVKDLAKPGLRLALGDPKAMALGRTADEILENSGSKAEILKNLTVYGATVKQLSLYLIQGTVDVSIIARADAFQARDKIESVSIPEHLYTPSKIGIAVFSTSGNPEDAMAFQRHISQRESIQIFMDAGFLPFKESKAE